MFFTVLVCVFIYIYTYIYIHVCSFAHINLYTAKTYEHIHSSWTSQSFFRSPWLRWWKREAMKSCWKGVVPTSNWLNVSWMLATVEKNLRQSCWWNFPERLAVIRAVEQLTEYRIIFLWVVPSPNPLILISYIPMIPIFVGYQQFQIAMDNKNTITLWHSNMSSWKSPSDWWWLLMVTDQSWSW